MNKIIGIVMLLLTSTIYAAETNSTVSTTRILQIDRGLSVEGAKCVSCHSKETPNHVNDWKASRHGHVGVSCIDCHSVDEDSPMAAQNCPGVQGTGTFVTPLVSSAKCSQCHPAEAEQFKHSGHFRGRFQIESKQGMMDMMNKLESRSDIHPEFKNTVDIVVVGSVMVQKLNSMQIEDLPQILGQTLV